MRNRARAVAPVVDENPAVKLFVRVEKANGAWQEITALHPEPFLLEIGPKEEAAGLPAGIADPDRKEPLIAILFGGNPQAGGIQVHQEGVL